MPTCALDPVNWQTWSMWSTTHPSATAFVLLTADPGRVEHPAVERHADDAAALGDLADLQSVSWRSMGDEGTRVAVAGEHRPVVQVQRLGHADVRQVREVQGHPVRAHHVRAAPGRESVRPRVLCRCPPA